MTNLNNLSYPSALVGRSQDFLSGAYTKLDGWQITDRRAVLGQGQQCFEDSVRRLFKWTAHKHAGVHVTQYLDVVELRFLGTKSACQIVETFRGPNRALLIYGTLPEHVECGEEAFQITLDDSGEVHGHIVAFSRPNIWWARLLAPIVRRIQLRITDSYLQGLAAPK